MATRTIYPFDPTGVGGDSPAITSVILVVNNDPGVPNGSASLENGVLTITLTGVKGETGNTGYTGDIDLLKVINNLQDGGEKDALSAEMGKRLKQLIDRVFGNIEQSGSGNVVTSVEQKDGEPGVLLVRKEKSVTNTIDITQDDYNALVDGGDVDQHTWYYIYEDEAPYRLSRIYIGDTLFADRNSSSGFAYNFPIIF